MREVAKVGKATNNKKLIASVILLERFVRNIYPAKHSSAIQPLQWSILRYLARMPDDRCEVRWIANFLGMTRAPVTRAVATLADRGLVRQLRSCDDARTKTIWLTELGVHTLSDDPIHSAVERLRELSDDEQAQFMKSIRSLTMNSRGTGDE